MTIEERFNLVEQVGEEIIDREELKDLLQSDKELIAYDGFEPSGQMHIAQGILRVINVNKMIKAGFKFKMLVADWHGWANNKMDGDLEKIRTVGEYFIEVWKAAGMDLDNVEFIWASELINSTPDYWKLVLQIARESTLKRILKTTQIMGRKESDLLSAAQIIYPCMQAADIFMLGANVTQLGMDQRKVNMLARQVGPQLGFWKPVVVSHHMLLGLGKPSTGEKDARERAIELKMSKSKPDTAIFMTDTKEDIERKLAKAWCPEGVVEENPILEYFKYILFEKFDSITFNRPEKFGGPLTVNDYQELEKLFASKDLHPLDVKASAVEKIDQLLQPVRKHFSENAKAKSLLEKVQSFQVTR